MKVNNTGPIVMPDIPDFLGVAARVERIAGLLQNGQEQIAFLHAVMVANCDTEDDLVTQQVQPGQPQPDPITYGERIANLRKGMAQLMEENEDIHEELMIEAARRRDEVKTRIQKQHSNE